MDNGSTTTDLGGFVSTCVIFPESFPHVQLSFQKNDNSCFPPPTSYFIGRGHEVNSLNTIIITKGIQEVWEHTLPTLGKQLG